jgi:hypothetical protein
MSRRRQPEGAEPKPRAFRGPIVAGNLLLPLASLLNGHLPPILSFAPEPKVAPQGDGVTPNDSPKSLRSARPEHPPLRASFAFYRAAVIRRLSGGPILMGNEIILAQARSHTETDDHQAGRMIRASA